MAAERDLTPPRRATCESLEGSSAGVFGHGRAVAGRRRPGGAVGVQGIGFALSASRCSVGSVDLDDVNVVVLQCLGESGSVAAGALHARGEHPRPEAARPGERGPVAGAEVGAELGIAEDWPVSVMAATWMGVEVGVDADGQLRAWGCHDGGVPSPCNEL